MVGPAARRSTTPNAFLQRGEKNVRNASHAGRFQEAEVVGLQAMLVHRRNVAAPSTVRACHWISREAKSCDDQFNIARKGPKLLNVILSGSRIGVLAQVIDGGQF